MYTHIYIYIYTHIHIHIVFQSKHYYPQHCFLDLVESYKRHGCDTFEITSYLSLAVQMVARRGAEGTMGEPTWGCGRAEGGLGADSGAEGPIGGGPKAADTKLNSRYEHPIQYFD